MYMWNGFQQLDLNTVIELPIMDAAQTELKKLGLWPTEDGEGFVDASVFFPVASNTPQEHAGPAALSRGSTFAED